VYAQVASQASKKQGNFADAPLRTFHKALCALLYPRDDTENRERKDRTTGKWAKKSPADRQGTSMMSEAVSVKRRTTRLVGVILAAAAVSACTEGAENPFLQQKKPAATEEVTRNSSSAAKLPQKDVEAPDVFSVSEAGLWDGRPSLGGVWVAHPDVVDPERVIIRNAANNQFVVGALFRRERDNPGPRIQASSDAAVALGMLAGAPVQLSVTALRREEIVPEPEAVEETEVEETKTAEATPTGSETGEVIADAAAEASTGTAAATTAVAAEAVKPRQKTWFGQGLFANKKKTETAETLQALPAEPEVASSELPMAEPAAEPMAAPEVIAVAANTDRKKPWFGQRLFKRKEKSVGEPLSALTPQPVVATTELPAAQSAAPDSQPVTEPVAKPSLTKPFIQIGIFNQEGNAETAAGQMRGAGIVPTVYEQSSSGKTFWRVVVGPAQDQTERSALLAKIKGVGFEDAYPVTN